MADFKTWRINQDTNDCPKFCSPCYDKERLQSGTSNLKTQAAVESSIPRIIHQSWKTAEIPAAWINFRNSWKQAFPSFQYILWTDKDNRNLIRTHYPWFLDIFDQYPRAIQRADVARYFVLHKYGGLYVDLDYECLQPFPDLFELTHKVAFPLSNMPWELFQNSLMASCKLHPFWQEVFEILVQRHNISSVRWRYVQHTTGPEIITDAYYKYPQKDDIVKLNKDEFLRGGFAVHHQSGSWRNILDRLEFVKQLEHRLKRKYSSIDPSPFRPGKEITAPNLVR